MSAIATIDLAEKTASKLKSLLHSAGYSDLLLFPSPAELFEKLNETRPSIEKAFAPDLIILDIRPGKGLSSCRELAAGELTNAIPILGITEDTHHDFLEKFFNAGLTDFVTAPLKKPVLLARVANTLRITVEARKRRAQERLLIETKEALLDRDYKILQLQQRIEEADREFQRISTMDGLTGISNRRGFDEFLDIEWSRAIRESMPLTLLIVDIDHFKPYNDAHGHLMGDECLIKVANSLQDTLNRSTDIIARHGGEEFAALLPNTEINGALTVAEKMRESVIKLQIPHDKSKVCKYLTVSIGAASHSPKRNSKFRCFFAAADEALYDAKRSGRNLVKAAD
ncbi:MAG: diguanylate cyclase [Thermodesulfobacteriota bacterium]